MTKKILKIIFVLWAIWAMSVTLVTAKSIEEEYTEILVERWAEDMQAFWELDSAVDDEEFALILKLKQRVFQESHNVYKNKPQGLSPEIAKLAKRLESASGKMAEAIDLFFSSPEELSEQEFERLMIIMSSGINEYGAIEEDLRLWTEEYESTRNLYLYGTIFGIFGFVLFLIFSKRIPRESTEGAGKSVVLSLAQGGFGMVALGFGLTLVTYEWMPGETYFIFWGLPLYGGYMILKGVYLYLKYRNR